MERCEDFEVKIEMRLHGALDAPETDHLATHLASCVSCRAFEALAKGSENAMNQQTNLHLQTLDWDGLWKRTKTFFETQSRHRLISSAIVICALAPMTMLAVNDVLGTGALVFGTWAAAIAWTLLSSRYRLRAICKYEGDTGELLFFYRRELEDRLRRTRTALGVFPLWMMLFAFRVLHPHGSTRELVGFIGMGVVSLAGATYVWLVRRPRIARELAELKADLKSR